MRKDDKRRKGSFKGKKHTEATKKKIKAWLVRSRQGEPCRHQVYFYRTDALLAARSYNTSAFGSSPGKKVKPIPCEVVYKA